MPSEVSPTSQGVARIAVPNRISATKLGQALAAAMSGPRRLGVRCKPSHAPIVASRPRCLSFPAGIVQFTAAIVIARCADVKHHLDEERKQPSWVVLLIRCPRHSLQLCLAYKQPPAIALAGGIAFAASFI